MYKQSAAAVSEMPDEKLIRFYLSSHPAALATLTDLYKDRIYGTVVALVQDKAAAEVIFGNVFNTLVNRLLGGQGPESDQIIPWANALARELSLEWLRKQALPEETLPQTSAAARPLVYGEWHDRVKSLISVLPDPQREVIALNHYGGLSFREIATRMQCSVTNALDYMRAGLANLRLLMTEQEVWLR